MNGSTIPFAITLVLGVVFDMQLYSWSSRFWNENVHKVISENISGMSLVERIPWYIADGLAGALVILGIGFILATVLVYPVYYRLFKGQY